MQRNNLVSSVSAVSTAMPHLPASYSRDNADEGEGDHAEGDQDTHLQQVILEGGRVDGVDGWKGLRTERISHLGSLAQETRAPKRRGVAQVNLQLGSAPMNGRKAIRDLQVLWAVPCRMSRESGAAFGPDTFDTKLSL